MKQKAFLSVTLMILVFVQGYGQSFDSEDKRFSNHIIKVSLNPSIFESPPRDFPWYIGYESNIGAKTYIILRGSYLPPLDKLTYVSQAFNTSFENIKQESSYLLEGGIKQYYGTKLLKGLSFYNTFAFGYSKSNVSPILPSILQTNGFPSLTGSFNFGIHYSFKGLFIECQPINIVTYRSLNTNTILHRITQTCVSVGVSF